MLKAVFKWSYLIYALLYVALPAYAVFSILGKPVIGTDDSNIYLQYTRNFTSGFGIVYNPGGEHVEGFSSTLYFLVCSFFNLFTASPEILILLFNLLIALVSCMLMLHTIKSVCEKYEVPPLHIHLFYFVYLFWVFINPAFFGWTIITLMDSGIYTFLLICGYAYFIQLALSGETGKKQTRAISVCVFLMIIARPEGVIWSAVYLFMYFILVYRNERSFGTGLKKISKPLLCFVATIGALTLYRLWYFGYPLPNTYYTKVSASFVATLTDGFGYFSGFVKTYNFIVLIFTVILLFRALSWLMKKEFSPMFYVSIITLGFIITGLMLPVIEGGDHFHAFRFFQPVYPFLIIPLIILVLVFGKTVSFRGLFMYSVPACFVLSFFNHADWKTFQRNNNTFQGPEDVNMCIRMEFYIAEYTRENGRRLNDFFKGDLPVIGFGAAGGIAIGYDGIVYDMLGLNLPELAHADKIKVGPKAHQSFNKKVFYKLNPDVLMPTAELSNTPVSLANVSGYYCNPNSWDNLIYKNIFNDAEFKEKYTLALAVNTLQPDYICYGYFNNDYLKKLSAKSNFKFQILN